jgi:hypothetical protein
MGLDILGKFVPVLPEQNLHLGGEKVDGYYCPEVKSIFIEINLHPDKYISTLIHESGHALLDRINLQGYLDEMLAEVIVESFKNVFIENVSRYFDLKSPSSLQ